MKLNKKIKLLISADGGAGSGKTTASKLIAKKFGLKLLTSGLLYRYVAFKLLNSKIIHSKKNLLANIIKKINIKKLKNKNLYAPEVTNYASIIAKKKKYKRFVKKISDKIFQ